MLHKGLLTPALKNQYRQKQLVPTKRQENYFKKNSISCERHFQQEQETTKHDKMSFKAWGRDRRKERVCNDFEQNIKICIRGVIDL